MSDKLKDIRRPNGAEKEKLQILHYLRNDLRLIFRDPILYVLLFVPLIFICLLRFALPLLIQEVPVMDDYSMLVLATFCLVTSMFPAFLYSFIMLDEKDQDLVSVIRILPISSMEFVLIRLLFITFYSYLFIVVIIIASGVLEWPDAKILLAALPVSLIAPVMTLFIVAFARNKIEGATWMKGLNFVFFLPVLSYFIAGSYEYVLGLLPVYWIFKMFDPGFSSLHFYQNYLIAMIYDLILLLAGIKIYLYKVFPGD